MKRFPAPELRLSEILEPDRNSFGVVRLAMATAVLVSHSYFFVWGTTTAEPLHGITGHSLGEHAVQVFFFLSGVLVMQSFTKSGCWIDFAAARALRIFPGLIVCVLLTALVLGPQVSALPTGQYFLASALPQYIAKTLLLITGSAPLPGVFADNPAASLVNMSLWTLKYEVMCYLALGLICATGVLTGRHRHLATLALAIFVAGVFLDQPQPVEAYTAAANVRYFALYFGMGVLACQLREQLVIKGSNVVFLLVLFIALLGTRWSELACAMFVGYATLYVATFDFGRFGRTTQTTDVSFGLYIYAGPIQQALVQLTPAISPLVLAVVAFVPTLAVAVVSWFVIEKPAMARRKSVIASLKRHAAQQRVNATRETPVNGGQVPA